MSRDGAIIFADLIGKLDVLYVHCPKCSRAGPLSGAAFNRGMRTLALNEMVPRMAERSIDMATLYSSFSVVK